MLPYNGAPSPLPIGPGQLPDVPGSKPPDGPGPYGLPMQQPMSLDVARAAVGRGMSQPVLTDLGPVQLRKPQGPVASAAAAKQLLGRMDELAKSSRSDALRGELELLRPEAGTLDAARVADLLQYPRTDARGLAMTLQSLRLDSLQRIGKLTTATATLAQRVLDHAEQLDAQLGDLKGSYEQYRAAGGAADQRVQARIDSLEHMSNVVHFLGDQVLASRGTVSQQEAFSVGQSLGGAVGRLDVSAADHLVMDANRS
jgi:hypothetical protein